MSENEEIEAPPGSALRCYRELPWKQRPKIRRRTLQLAGHRRNAALYDAIDRADHPKLEEALREWWHSEAPYIVFRWVDSGATASGREFAITAMLRRAAVWPSVRPSLTGDSKREYEMLTGGQGWPGFAAYKQAAIMLGFEL